MDACLDGGVLDRVMTQPETIPAPPEPAPSRSEIAPVDAQEHPGGRYMVITHKVDMDKRGSANVSPMAWDTIVAMALESWCPGDRCE